MTVPTPPRFATVEAEREHRKQRLAATLRIFARFGYDEGAAGHVTARDPEHPDRFWVNPLLVPFSRVRVSDLLLVDADGRVVVGDRAVNRAAFAIHSQVHAARPDVVAAAHTHSVHGRAFSTLGIPLAPLTQDATAFHDDHAVFGEYTGVVLDPADGKRIAHALGDTKAVILRNHGLLTVGTTVDAAAFWYVSLERSCQVQLLAMAAGTPAPIPAELARATHASTGGEDTGWLSFQPLYDDIVAAQPDLLG